MTESTSGDLRLQDVLTLAERASGAYGLIDEGLRSRVAAAVEWINARGPYTRDELRGMRAQLHQLLATRLKLKLDRQRFPGIAEQKIERPIFVVGFARSGTTLLHSLLAEDPQALAPLGWHMYSPSPPPGAGPVAPERIAYAQRQLEAWMDLCPAQKQMHPYIDKGAFQLCEDEEILSLDFRLTYPYQFSKVVSLDQFVVLDPDQHAGFRFHREVLQHLQWNTGKDRWVCKGVSVQGDLDALFAAYPDALCVWPHRPIAEIYASSVALMIATYDAITGRANDWTGLGHGIAQGMKAGLDAVMANALIDDPRVVHLKFRDIATDPLAAVRQIHGLQGRDVSPEHEARIAAWLAAPENTVDRHGRYPYSYETLGLDRGWVEELFADYSKRFGLA